VSLEGVQETSVAAISLRLFRKMGRAKILGCALAIFAAGYHDGSFEDSTMNAAFLHLVINHAPLYFMVIAAALLVGALVRRNRSLLSAGTWLVIAAGIGAVVTLQTGEQAEHLLEHAPGINATAIEAHEESAKVAVLATIVAAGLAIGVTVGQRWWGERFRWGASSVLLAAVLTSLLLVALAAHRGGLIRHAEELENRLPPPTPEE
jgi:uncharacterized membrane protein